MSMPPSGPPRNPPGHCHGNKYGKGNRKGHNPNNKPTQKSTEKATSSSGASSQPALKPKKMHNTEVKPETIKLADLSGKTWRICDPYSWLSNNVEFTIERKAPLPAPFPPPGQPAPPPPPPPPPMPQPPQLPRGPDGRVLVATPPLLDDPAPENGCACGGACDCAPPEPKPDPEGKHQFTLNTIYNGRITATELDINVRTHQGQREYQWQAPRFACQPIDDELNRRRHTEGDREYWDDLKSTMHLSELTELSTDRFKLVPADTARVPIVFTTKKNLTAQDEEGSEPESD